MSKRRKRRTNVPQAPRDAAPMSWEREYERACAVAEQGDWQAADRLLAKLSDRSDFPESRRLDLDNDRAVLAIYSGDLTDARAKFASILHRDPYHVNAWLNLRFIDGHRGVLTSRAEFGLTDWLTPLPKPADDQRRIAVVSFWFNWPDTGGGGYHTVEMTAALAEAGYRVRHFSARYLPWEIGKIDEPLPFDNEVLDFTDADWDPAAIRDRFQRAVAAFAPDAVLIADAWNFKPHLAVALAAFPVVLVFQALECLCPLNNVRLFLDANGNGQQCYKNQLATPQACLACTLAHQKTSSSGMHERERHLSGFGAPEYDALLRQSLENAHAVVAMNPLIETMLAPYARRVVVAPAGIDRKRFAWPPETQAPSARVRIFFAGSTKAYIKGFAVLRRACASLWERRQDFQLVATGPEPAEPVAFCAFIGWLGQTELAGQYARADICVVPSLAQESFGRVAAEAMAAGKPVVASRIGGLPFTVQDEATGLLFEPGDADDLAAKLERLLDDAELRARLGAAGRKRFEEHFTWDTIVATCLKPLFDSCPRSQAPSPASQPEGIGP